MSLAGGCSDAPAGNPIGGGFSGSFTNTGGTPAATAGTTSTSGTSFGTSGSNTGTSGTGTSGSTGTAGTFSTGGTFSTAGTDAGGTSTGGTAAGTGGSSAGTGGTATAGTDAGGTAAGGTAPTGDFPAGCNAPTGTKGTALTRSCWTITASDCAQTNDNKNPPGQAIDASLTSRFSTGVQMTASKLYTVDVDLGTAVMVNGISLLSEKTDFPPQLEVLLSTDGTLFTPIACGDGAVTTDFAFPATNARYVRFIQHGIVASWWSIEDLNIYAATGDSCAGGGTQMSVCTTPHTT